MKRLFLLLALIALGLELFAVTPPPKPTRNQIAKDLVGHRLKEGYDNGWFPSDWVWVIEEGEIKAMKIEEVLKDTDTDYSINVVMRLEGDGKTFKANGEVVLKVKDNAINFLEEKLSFILINELISKSYKSELLDCLYT